MKKLFLILVLGFVWSGSAFAEILKLDKCLQNKYPQEETWYDLSKDIEDIIFYANLSNGTLTWETIYTEDTRITKPGGKKPTKEIIFLNIERYENEKIIARSYYIQKPDLRQLMISPNDNTLIHRDVTINLKTKMVKEIINPGGKIIFDTIKYDWIDKKMNEEFVTEYKCDSKNDFKNENKVTDILNDTNNENGFFKNILGGVLKK